MRAVDSVRLFSTKCLHVVQTTPEPPVPGWVRNGAAAHRAFVASLDACFWGGFSTPEGAGGVRAYQWGVGTTPGGAEVLPLADAPYVRQGTVPALALDSATPYYCTVRALTATGQSVTVSSPSFRVCPAVARATVGVHYYPGPEKGAGTVCGTWDIPALDPGAACVARLEWAVGHWPYNDRVREFATVQSSGACASVPLVDGGTYYVTVRATSESGAVAAFASRAAHVDTSPPAIAALTFGFEIEGPQGPTMLQYVPPDASLTVRWSVAEPHTEVLASTLTLWGGGAEVAVVAVADPREGTHTFPGPFAVGTEYRAELRSQAYLRPGVRYVGAMGCGRDALEGGEAPPPRGAQPCPAAVPLTATASFNDICNRQ